MIQLWQLYVLALSLGTLNALDNPTRQTLVAELVPSEDLPNAVALNSLSFNTSRLIGPAARRPDHRGWSAWPAASCSTRSASSAWSPSLLLIRARPRPVTADRRRGAMISQIARGAALRVRHAGRAVRGDPDGGHRLLWLQLPDDPAADRRSSCSNADAASFGLLTSSMAIGSVGVGAADGEPWQGHAAAHLHRRDRVQRAAVLRPVRLSWCVLIPLLVALGAFSILFGSSANVHLQTVTPPALRGRVMSIYTLLFLGSTPIGSMIVGTLAEQQGVQIAIAEMALCCASAWGLASST